MPEDNNTLKKVADRVSGLGKILVTPQPSDAEGLKAVQDNVDEYENSIHPNGSTGASSPAPDKNKRQIYNQDLVNPHARYGDRSGEKRIDTTEMTKGLGQIKSYDGGGDVEGDQIAKLHDGEKVLTPEEAAAYDTKQSPAPLVSPAPTPSKGSAQADEAPATDFTTSLIQQDKEDAAEKGDLVGLGKAVLNERHFGPKDLLRPQEDNAPKPTSLGRINVPTITSDVPGVIRTPLVGEEKHQDTAGGSLVSGAPTNDSKSTQRDFASMERKAKLADYDQRIQQALDLGTPEGQTQADRLRAAKMNYQTANPWGSEGNHPGALGKIAHIASRVGNIAGDIFAPSTMELIPGTQLNRAARAGQLGRAISEDSENELRKAQANAADDKTPKTGTPEQQYIVAAQELRQAQASGDPQAIGKAQGKLDDIHAAINSKDLSPKDEAASAALIKDHLAKMSSLGLTGKAAEVYGNPPAGATAAELEKRYADAAQLKSMNQKDAENKINEQLRRDQENEHKQEFTERQGEKLVNYRDANGDLISGTRAEALANGVKEKDIHGETSPALEEKARQAYTQYSRILDNTQSALDSLPSWDDSTSQGAINRKAAMDVSKQYWEHLTGNAYVAGVGINPEYTQQFINSDAYKKMDRAGQEHMQNMFQLWSDAINIVKQETGGVPRGQVFLQREDAILPHPDKSQTMNEKALQNLAKRVHKDAQEFARPSDIAPLQRGVVPPTATHLLRDNKTGQVIGYTDDQGKDQKF